MGRNARRVTSKTLSSRLPGLRHHKPSGRAVVTLGGKDVYVGRWGTGVAKAEYDRVVSIWLANGRRSAPESDLSIAELVEQFLQWAIGYYKIGKGTGELEPLRRALTPLVVWHGCETVADFGPLKLKTLRQRWIDEGRCRDQINKAVRRVVRAFRWGVENELVPGEVVHRLRAVAGLRFGRSGAKESPPVSPAPTKDVDAVLHFVATPVRAMIEVQRLTGCRPGEVVQMSSARLDRSRPVWEYRPASHKTQHHGRDRVVYIGPRCQEILQPFLEGRAPNAPLFSPREAMADLRSKRFKTRVTPLTQGNRPGSNCKAMPRKQPGDAYDVQSYGKAVAYACKKLNLPIWSPNRLRHLAATRVRAAFGLEAAQVFLGHSRADVTQVYAERDAAKAADVVLRVG